MRHRRCGTVLAGAVAGPGGAVVLQVMGAEEAVHSRDPAPRRSARQSTRYTGIRRCPSWRSGFVLTCVPAVGTLSPRARARPGNSCVRPSRKRRVSATAGTGQTWTSHDTDKSGSARNRARRARGPDDTPDRGGRSPIPRRATAVGRTRQAHEVRCGRGERPKGAEKPGAHDPAAGPQGPPGEDEQDQDAGAEGEPPAARRVHARVHHHAQEAELGAAQGRSRAS